MKIPVIITDRWLWTAFTFATGKRGDEFTHVSLFRDANVCVSMLPAVKLLGSDVEGRC